MEPLKKRDTHNLLSETTEDHIWPWDRNVCCWLSHSRVPWGEVHRGLGPNKFEAFIHYGYGMRR